MTETASIAQRWRAAQPSKTLLGWSCVATVIGTIVVGFVWGGWVTGGSARAMAESAADHARSELVATICVDRFEAAPDATVKLEALRGTQGWNRRDFIQKGGWTAMPDKAKPGDQAATLCAEKLLSRADVAGKVSSAQ